jgi:hypothetical protein
MQLCEYEQMLYPNHHQWVQSLSPADCSERAAFSPWLLKKCAINPHFLTFNSPMKHNTNVWGDENLHAILQSRHQHQFLIHMCAGIVGDRVLGPSDLPSSPTEAAAEAGKYSTTAHGRCKSMNKNHT